MVDQAVSAELTDVICAIVAAVGNTECRPDTSLPHLGLDSLGAAETAAVVEHTLSLPVPLEAILGAPTPAAAADTLLAHWETAGHTPEAVRTRLASIADGSAVR
jgi:acyl carrier protein